MTRKKYFFHIFACKVLLICFGIAQWGIGFYAFEPINEQTQQHGHMSVWLKDTPGEQVSHKNRTFR